MNDLTIFQMQLSALKNHGKQTPESIQHIIDHCKFKDWEIRLKFTDPETHLGPYLQVVFTDKDAFTGEEEEQFCRKWTLSYHMCDTEVVDTVYAAIERAMRHEVMEQFKFLGRRIYNPHRNVYSLYDVSSGQENIDIREPNM